MSRKFELSSQALGYYIPIIISYLAFMFSNGDGEVLLNRLLLLFTLYFLIVILIKFGIPEPRALGMPIVFLLISIELDGNEQALMFWVSVYSFIILQLIFLIVSDDYKKKNQSYGKEIPEWAIKSQKEKLT